MEDCSYCTDEIAVINKLANTHKNILISVYIKNGSLDFYKNLSAEVLKDSQTSAMYGVKKWPSVYVKTRGGKEYLIEGFASYDNIISLLAKEGRV